MNKKQFFYLLIVLVLSLSACSSGKTLDTTNMQTFESSMNAMMAELEGEKKAKFQESVAYIGVALLSVGFKNMFNSEGSGKAEKEFLSQFDGLDADELIEKVKELNEKGEFKR